jgi:hypothetical protein
MGPHVTETIYRHLIVPAIRSGATVIGHVFDDEPSQGDASEQGDTAASA